MGRLRATPLGKETDGMTKKRPEKIDRETKRVFESDASLGDKLFMLVEYHQGLAYISDGVGGLEIDDARVIRIARASLTNTRIVAKKLEAFLRQYSEEDR